MYLFFDLVSIALFGLALEKVDEGDSKTLVKHGVDHGIDAGGGVA